MPDYVIYDYVLPYNDKYAVIIKYFNLYGLSYYEYSDNVRYVNYICDNNDIITLQTGNVVIVINNDKYIDELKLHISDYVMKLKIAHRYHDIRARISFCNIKNFGDIYNIYCARQYNKNVTQAVSYDVLHYVMVGSIIRKPYVNKYSIICGAGIMNKSAKFTKPYRTLFVRGPRTRQRFIELGYECPEVYGDMALCLPLYYKPIIEQIYNVGIAPHYIDYNVMCNNYGNNYNVITDINIDRDQTNIVHIINLAIDVTQIEKTINEILKCKIIITSSLHGIIVCHAYGIPVIWVNSLKGLDGDNIKFSDYAESVGLYDMQSYDIDDIMKLSYDEMMKIYNKHKPDRKLITNIQQNINNIMMNMLS